ncbi:thiocillin family RiPP [Yimella sp. cx-573]|nr:thiocillin family RiPP [Yimella sp. cx-573]
MSDLNKPDVEIEFFDENLEIETLEEGINPGFTSAFSAATAASASCPAGSVGSFSSLSSQGN